MGGKRTEGRRQAYLKFLVVNTGVMPGEHVRVARPMFWAGHLTSNRVTENLQEGTLS